MNGWRYSACFEILAPAPADLVELGDLRQRHHLGDELGREDRVDCLCRTRDRCSGCPQYSRSGWTAIATLAGSVQGVVVQIIACQGAASPQAFGHARDHAGS